MVGQGSVSIDGKEMRIEAGDGSVFRHDRFNVESDETVRFLQPSSQARVLNRIEDSSPSQIHGNIQANGQLYLVNPSGVVFGENASVEAARLHVAAGELSNDNFISRRDHFTNLRGEVENYGKIEAQAVSISANKVMNHGQVHAPSGYIALSAGDQVELIESDGSLGVILDSSQTGHWGSVANGPVYGDLGGQAVLGTGVLNANTVHLSAKSIQADGIIEGDQIVIQTDSTNGAYKANSELIQHDSTSVMRSNQLRITYPVDGDSSVALPSPSNQIKNLEASGDFSSFSVSSSSDLRVKSASSENSAPSFRARHLDLRSYQGDLSIDTAVHPPPSASDSSMLLAADGTVSLSAPTSEYPYLRRVVYGRQFDHVNESPSTSTQIPNQKDGQSTFQELDANHIEINELSASLPPDLVLALAKENPLFAEIQSSAQLELEGLSDAQLRVLLEYGYLSGYSYFLKRRNLGFNPADLFGGDYSVLDRDKESDEENEEDKEANSPTTSDSQSPRQRMISAIPYAPITPAVLSPAASRILDEALSDQVESSLQKYLRK